MAYSDKQKKEIINEVCERMLNLEAVRNILKDDHMPDFSTLCVWLDGDDELSKQYARGFKMRADARFEQIDEIVNEDCSYTYHDSDGNEITRTDSGKVQHQRLKLDAVKWQASKENSKKYGDKLQTELSGKVQTEDVTELSTEKIKANMLELAQKAAEAAKKSKE